MNNILDDEYYNDVLALNMAWTLNDEEDASFHNNLTNLTINYLII